MSISLPVYIKTLIVFTVVVMEMQPVEIPEFPKLRGEEAIETLCCHILELEEQRGKELSDKQTTALIKFVKGLISSIEVETSSTTAMTNLARSMISSFEAETRLSPSDKEMRARWFGENKTKENQLRWLRYIFTT